MNYFNEKGQLLLQPYFDFVLSRAPRHPDTPTVPASGYANGAEMLQHGAEGLMNESIELLSTNYDSPEFIQELCDCFWYYGLTAMAIFGKEKSAEALGGVLTPCVNDTSLRRKEFKESLYWARFSTDFAGTMAHYLKGWNRVLSFVKRLVWQGKIRPDFTAHSWCRNTLKDFSELFILAGPNFKSAFEAHIEKLNGRHQDPVIRRDLSKIWQDQ